MRTPPGKREYGSSIQALCALRYLDDATGAMISSRAVLDGFHIGASRRGIACRCVKEDDVVLLDGVEGPDDKRTFRVHQDEEGKNLYARAFHVVNIHRE